jgi:2-dehydro-3-deoxygalactonokinase
VADTQLIALDWGTTSLRAYRFDGSGQVAESRHLASGILRVATDGGAPAGDPYAGFERAFDEACGDWRSASPGSPILACGMIGSAQGWREAGYLEAPTDVGDLGRALTRVETGSGAVLHIIPGIIDRGPLPEVMRGEETQVAGVIGHGIDGVVEGVIDGGAAAPPGADARAGASTELWIGLPGTHAKWVRVQDRRIIGFHTFLTGEVFAALCAHTILGRTMRPPATPDLAAFDRGVAVARSPRARAGVLSTMFSTRTLGLVGELAAEAQADYLSGLLVGHELAGLEQLGARLESAVLVGSDALCQRYRRALAAFGHPVATIAADATERGLWRVACSAGLVRRRAAC